MNKDVTFETLCAALTEAELLLKAEKPMVDMALKDVVYDSRKATPGCLFLCKGAAFKPAYIEAARERGAVAILAEKTYSEMVGLPYLLVSDVRAAMAVVANVFFDYPWRKLNVIGVTGTKGKSTTAQMIRAIFDARGKRLGLPPCGITSSARVYDGKVDEPAKLTTPESIDLYRHLANAVAAGLDVMVVEVSSQALKYDRVAGIHFQHGLFLNIAPDHIGPIEHPDFDDYFAAKRLLFQVSEHVHLNRDSDHFNCLLEAAAEAPEMSTFSLAHEADLKAVDIASTLSGMAFRLVSREGDLLLSLPLHGRFNVENALAAISVVRACGLSDEDIISGLANLKMAGHMTYLTGQEVTVVVDFAHNEISFRRVFAAVEEEYPEASKIVVFGAPGNKAESRRQGMGQVAGKNANLIYLTADDPAYEEVASINREIRESIDESTSVIEIEDRQLAIEKAILEAPVGAVVLLLGKGDEHAMKIKGKDEPWPGDESLAKRALEMRSERNKSVL